MADNACQCVWIVCNCLSWYDCVCLCVCVCVCVCITSVPHCPPPFPNGCKAQLLTLDLA